MVELKCPGCRLEKMLFDLVITPDEKESRSILKKSVRNHGGITKLSAEEFAVFYEEVQKVHEENRQDLSKHVESCYKCLEGYRWFIIEEAQEGLEEDDKDLEATEKYNYFLDAVNRIDGLYLGIGAEALLQNVRAWDFI